MTITSAHQDVAVGLSSNMYSSTITKQKLNYTSNGNSRFDVHNEAFANWLELDLLIISFLHSFDITSD